MNDDHQHTHPDASGQIELARRLLDSLGLSPADLLTTGNQQSAPTFADYIPRVADAVKDGTRRVYRPYWNRILERWGDRQLTDITALDIKRFTEHISAHALVRRNAREGRGAGEHALAALRCVYNQAVADGLLTEASNPARRVPKPRRLPSTRRALPDTRLAEINQVAATTGNDPELDTLLLRLHTETACRRGGVLSLRPHDLDVDQCLILLHEKGGTVRWQPISPTLMTHLRTHAHHRGGLNTTTPLLRYTNGRPITTRRYDHLWTRIGTHLPWVATQQITTHWLRHTTLTWVERHFGYAIARAYAGHTDTSHNTGTTTTYVRASLHEVATALAALAGEPHPLATDPGR